jgi:uncharacterized membrane protein
MSTLVVLAFRDEAGAERTRDRLAGLKGSHLIRLTDATVVVRGQDGKVQVKQAVSLVEDSGLGEAFLGSWVGLLLSPPWSAQGGAPGDSGIDDKFVKDVAAKIEPGRSALFLLVSGWTEDRVMDEIKDLDAEVFQTSLSREDEVRLASAPSAPH